jgi:hypothetical protein
LGANSFLARAKYFVFGATLLYTARWYGAVFIHLMPSKRTIGLTHTSPTSHVGPMPPAVPVVMISFGRTSSMICFQTS